MLSIVVIIISILLQQFNVVNALVSPNFMSSSLIFFWALSDGLSCLI